MEIYKDILGYEGKYLISNYGNVKSLLTNKILKPVLATRKKITYKRISLLKDGKQLSFYIHRLVGIAFIANPEDKEYINHLDNEGTNNLVTNLEWATQSENMEHAHKQGRLDVNLKSMNDALQKKLKPKYDSIELMLGRNFISFSTIKGRKSVSYKCNNCDKEVSTRIDSKSYLTKKCKKCNRMKI